VAILQNSGLGFIHHGITMVHDVFNGNSMKYFTWNPSESPWKISHVFPMEFRRI